MVLRVIGKIFAFLFGKVGLWASAVFAAVYGACCLWAGWTFSPMWFGVGCVVAWVLGITVNLGIYRLRHPVVRAPKEKKRRKTLRQVPDEDAEVDDYVKETLPPKKQRHVRDEEPEPPREEDPELRREFDRKYLFNEKSKSTSEAEKLFGNEKERLWKGFERASAENAPMVFATRKDPNIFIYEYPDKLQFYRKSGDEMILLSTEYKEDRTQGKEYDRR